MSNFHQEQVVSVRHWTDRLFSFRTTRDPSLRFQNGQFIMMGLEVEGRPLVRAYSLVSANYEDELEFFSIKVPNGALTSRLQHVREGDRVIVSRKATGALVIDNLKAGRHLFLLATGTGLAPFLSIVKDPDIYERSERVVLVHGCRWIADLAYGQLIADELPKDEFVGQLIRAKLDYYPTVTREPFRHNGRISRLLESGKLAEDLALPPINPLNDRFMLCGSAAMLADISAILDARGFEEGSHSDPGDYAIEKAFAEK
ncbi:MAG TPA: ferredoxin--NADP reductase [Roseiarcus sp.]|nr:ferredoxin--NADP reductase [Roseiarcus sp.]